MRYPAVSGIVATDLNGAICYREDDKWHVIGKAMNHDCAELDKKVLEQYLSTLDDHIIVVGETTFRQMKGIIPEAKRTLVSNEIGTEEYIGNRKIETKGYDLNEDSKAQLLVRAFAMAMKEGYDCDIAVLGGKSVYEAFAGHYMSLIHCIYKKQYVGETKTVKVKDRETKDPIHDLLNQRESTTLLTMYYHYAQYVDNELFRVLEYKAT